VNISWCVLFLFSFLSFACGFVLFTLILRLDLGAVIVVIACVYFDIGYYLKCCQTKVDLMIEEINSALLFLCI